MECKMSFAENFQPQSWFEKGSIMDIYVVNVAIVICFLEPSFFQ